MCGYADPAAVQRGHGDLESFAFFAKHLIQRHFDVLEDQFHGLRRTNAHFVFFFAKGEARRAFFQDKRGNSSHASGLVGHRKYDIGFGFAGIGDENLAAVQHIVVAVQYCNRLLTGSIGAGVWLGQAECAHFFAFSQRLEIFLFLLFGAIGEDRPGAQRNRRRQGDPQTGVGFRNFFNC